MGKLLLPEHDWVSLVELLRYRSDRTRDASGASKLAFTFLDNGEKEGAKLSFADLDRRARAIAARLQQTAKAGDRALLLYPPGLDFVEAFFGCLYAGVIAVPAYPPDPTRMARTLPRLLAIANDADTSVVLTTKAILPMARALFPMAPELEKMTWVAGDSIEDDAATAWVDPAPSAESLAFLQYTSGSTATPKGVMVSHGNLLHNEKMIQNAFRTHDDTVVVSWLPLYHDMGLIGHVLHPMYLGGPCVLMSPIAFLKRPFRWLKAVSNYRGTISTGPNFAYDLCTRKVTDEQKAELDLSCWEQALNGAEPVRHETLERFIAAFKGCGFRRESFYPCYGLAEATLVVSGGKHDPAPVSIGVDRAALERDEIAAPSGENGARGRAQRLVASGINPVDDQHLVVVDTATNTRCAADRVGEIWIQGPSVAAGYWRRPQDTEEIFGARLADGSGPYLRTGDLGFVRDGYVFVTGRCKDLIVIRGQNYYPQDIEWAAERGHAALRPGSSAAFSIDHDSQEILVVVAEVDKRAVAGGLDADGIADAMRQAVTSGTGLYLHAVVLVTAGSIPKTSSGKIQRRPCRKAFLEGSLDPIGRSVALHTKKAEKSEQLCEQSAGMAEGGAEALHAISPYLAPVEVQAEA